MDVLGPVRKKTSNPIDKFYTPFAIDSAMNGWLCVCKIGSGSLSFYLSILIPLSPVHGSLPSSTGINSLLFPYDLSVFLSALRMWYWHVPICGPSLRTYQPKGHERYAALNILGDSAPSDTYTSSSSTPAAWCIVIRTKLQQGGKNDNGVGYRFSIGVQSLKHYILCLDIIRHGGWHRDCQFMGLMMWP